MKPLDIVLVNTQSIPSSGGGAASVNRILSYTKGLVNDGNNVRIISTAANNNNSWMEYEGVRVKHIGRPTNNIVKKLLEYFNTACKLIKALQDEKMDMVVYVTANYFLIVLLGVYCKLTRTILVNECSEYPVVLLSKNKFNSIVAPIYTNTAYRFLDGMIVISKPLKEYYAHKVNRRCKFLEVPMTVDVNRFENVMGTRARDVISELGDYIAYCGNMGGNKDGLKNLIQSFSIVEKRVYPLKLLLIGGTNNETEYEDLLAFNDSLGNKNVVFFGNATRDEMPVLLKGAKILVLARPSSLQSTGGFPTKLGEYLSTGNPVVVTSVGDIPRYLSNKENAYVVPPDDIEVFADAICQVWDHYDEAKDVGFRGKELAKTVFNGAYQAKRIEQFLNEILINKSCGK